MKMRLDLAEKSIHYNIFLFRKLSEFKSVANF
jgi:hypothetical protein